ncbi:hypothetical protein [Siphonobacter sp. SORGH_AS_0500]|uniref:hypothetical protein n=1 Tax=Siphonobacter sp. SORGH_AS_0500 TaxID=1864824 RepID=UPI000CAF9685|nr:hypothetical protein [Siphonobacter sp. SORGH_AS_0500]MDR6193436.1 hypothetical protein [Siphonobacter sp. SORGH_AS_0500]PKK35878.1 hypothetical protein BWI96_14095 [Siphonobacter sp. SORGH_AS_0500]PKK35959.1 hypothetical protein BWI96_14570 [Siphonobacter sp. SORGH_AS_0500]
MRILLTLFTLLLTSSTYAQLSLTPTRIFASGVNIRAEVTPAAKMNDTARLGYSRFNVQGIVPIRGGAGVKFHNFNLRKIDVEINQMFLVVNAGYRQPNFSFDKNDQGIYTGSLVLTGIHASLRDKIWLYAAGLGVSETDELLNFSKARPYGMGGAVRVRIAGPRTQWFYGGAVVFEPGRITPIPIAGINTRIAKGTRLMLVLPLQASVSQKITKKVWGEVGVAAGGFNAGYLTPNLNPNALRLAYRQAKASFTVNYSPIKPVQLSFEAGMTGLRTLKTMRAGDVLEKFTINSSPFMAVSCYFNLSKSILDSRGFGSVL